MATKDKQPLGDRLVIELLDAADEYARAEAALHAARDRRLKALVAVSRLGVPRATVAKMAGLTSGRVQQILDAAGESGVSGAQWGDREFRARVEELLPD